TDAVLLTINLTDGARETVAKANQYMEDNQFSMPVLLDTEGQAANAYKITSIPTTVIIDRQGNIRARFAGATTSEKLQSYVNQLK
ncbi:MAG: TlpA disulfide reductase family protein, partial [Syntrophomonas sp.]|nr:TlpA disulfide reductase family protein [Syntrophomonas sp.]